MYQCFLLPRQWNIGIVLFSLAETFSDFLVVGYTLCPENNATTLF